MFKKWETVFFSTNANDYYVIKGKLLNAGIKHKSRVGGNSRNRGHAGMDIPFSQPMNHEILVAEKDIDRANAIINDR